MLLAADYIGLPYGGEHGTELLWIADAFLCPQLPLGRRADRHIEAPDYSLSLQAEGRVVPLPDPLTARITSFVKQVQHGGPCPWTRPGDLTRRASTLEAAAAAHGGLRS